MMGTPSRFRRIAIIGCGLIGSSLARAIRARELAEAIAIADASAETVERIRELGFADYATTDLGSVVSGADLVIIAVPVGAYRDVAAAIHSHIGEDAIITDVGSVKCAVLRDLAPFFDRGGRLVPGHPIAGTERSGPDAGFATLFEGRWCILTPTENTDPTATERVAALWRACGSLVEVMSAEHHDRVLAITSHLPHLIAYTIVGTATDLEEHLQAEVIKFSASGFRDFTRIAASDPVMWRDVFLNNRDAVLEMLGRLYEDLALLQRAIRIGDGATLERHFTATRAIRRGIIDARQA